MPYKLRKAPRRELYWVVTKDSGMKHSKEPIPLKKARAQMKALYRSMKLEGGNLADGLIPLETTIELKEILTTNTYNDDESEMFIKLEEIYDNLDGDHRALLDNIFRQYVTVESGISPFIAMAEEVSYNESGKEVIRKMLRIIDNHSEKAIVTPPPEYSGNGSMKLKGGAGVNQRIVDALVRNNAQTENDIVTIFQGATMPQRHALDEIVQYGSGNEFETMGSAMFHWSPEMAPQMLKWFQREAETDTESEGHHDSDEESVEGEGRLRGGMENVTTFASVYDNIINELNKMNPSVQRLIHLYEDSPPQTQGALDEIALLCTQPDNPARDYLTYIDNLTLPRQLALINDIMAFHEYGGGALRGGMDKPSTSSHRIKAVATTTRPTEGMEALLKIETLMKEILMEIRTGRLRPWINIVTPLDDIYDALSDVAKNYIDSVFLHEIQLPYNLFVSRVGTRNLDWIQPAFVQLIKHIRELNEIRGSGNLKQLLVGAGLWDYLKDTTKKIKNEIFNPDSIARKRISDITKGIRTDYPPSVRSVLEKYGNYTIMGLRLRRDPVQSAIHQAFNLITLGQWNKGREETKMDTLFHLGIEARIGSGPNEHNLIIEKNEVINIGNLKPITSSTEYCRVPTPNPTITLLQFLKKGEDRRGGDFFKYDPFGNNCQDFVATLLMANGIYTRMAETFVKQNVESLLSRLPSYTHAVAKGITDLGGLANVALEGGSNGKFITQLRKAGIEPSAYLKEASRRAKEHHYPYKLLGFAQDGSHKLAIPDKNGKMVAFGKVGYGDHIIYSHLEKSHSVPSGTAEKKKRVFHKSHTKMRGAWASEPFSPNNLALRILW